MLIYGPGKIAELAAKYFHSHLSNDVQSLEKQKVQQVPIEVEEWMRGVTPSTAMYSTFVSQLSS